MPKPETSIRRQLASRDRILDRQVLAPTREVWAQEVARLERELGTEQRRNPTPIPSVGMLKTWTKWAGRALPRVLGELKGATQEVLAEGVRNVSAFFGWVSGHRSLLDDESTVRAVLVQRRIQLDSMRHRTETLLASSVSRPVYANFQAALVQQIPVQQLAGKLADLTDAQFWQVERIVRTETALAYNAVQHDAMVELSREHPKLQRRWTEMVNDVTGQPMDARVAMDSMALHGQVTTVRGVFTMPDKPGVPHGLLGKSWLYPPNRPNDRALVLPWEPTWGIPGWTYRG